jgi:hypothetical protein
VVHSWSCPSLVCTAGHVVVIDAKLSSSPLSTSPDVKYTVWKFLHQHRVPPLVHYKKNLNENVIQ